jgi:protein-S-isoprenylcysteine O-methyltransferase Ste14
MTVSVSPKMAFSIVVMTLANIGLAILGWGKVGDFFSHPARVVLIIVLVAMSGASLFTGGNISTGEREDRGNRWVIPAIVLVGFAMIYLSPYTDRTEFWTLDGDTVRWLGVVLYAIGGTLRIWPVFVLGNRFSGLVAIQHGHRLVTTGLYRVVRNPSYLGMLVGSLGWALAFRSAVGGLLTILLIPPLVARMRAEEALLRSHFGGEYEEYLARTWRLIPGVY